MRDTGKIFAGVLIFLALVTFPIWFTGLSGRLGAKPNLELPKGETKCIEATEYMRHWHMDLLNRWRDEVVREGKRIYVAEDGTRYEMSLTRTCLGCHTSKEKFCDRCHNYMGVEPYCWDCHVGKAGR